MKRAGPDSNEIPFCEDSTSVQIERYLFRVVYCYLELRHGPGRIMSSDDAKKCEECLRSIDGTSRNCKDCNALLHATMCGNESATGVQCGGCFVKSMNGSSPKMQEVFKFLFLI